MSYSKKVIYSATHTTEIAKSYFDVAAKYLISLADSNFVLTSSVTDSETNLYSSVTFTVFGTYDLTFSISAGGATAPVAVVGSRDSTQLFSMSVATASSNSSPLKMTVLKISNDNTVCLRFINCSNTMITNDIIITKKSNIVMISNKSVSGTVTQMANAMTEAFYNSSTNIRQYTAFNRLGYDYPATGQVEIIENKAFLESTALTVQVDGLYDCTTVTPDQLIMMDGNQYYCVDNHTLMEV